MSEKETENKEVREEIRNKFEALKEVISSTFDKDVNVLVIGSSDLGKQNFVAAFMRGNVIEFTEHLSRLISDDEKTSQIIRAAFVSSLLEWKKEDLIKLLKSVQLILMSKELKV